MVFKIFFSLYTVFFCSGFFIIYSLHTLYDTKRWPYENVSKIACVSVIFIQNALASQGTQYTWIFSFRSSFNRYHPIDIMFQLI